MDGCVKAAVAIVFAVLAGLMAGAGDVREREGESGMGWVVSSSACYGIALALAIGIIFG